MKWNFKLFALMLVVCLLTACASAPMRDGPPKRRVDISRIQNPTPRYLPKSRYGNPKSYVVNGLRYYVLKTARGYNKRGIASWYGTKFQGRLTSTREPYDLFGMTAASPVLPIPTYVRVTNLQNNRTIIVKVNDRGPFAPNRIIDLSYVAARKLGYVKTGTALVQVTAIDTTNPAATPSPSQLVHPKLYLQLGAFRSYDNAEQLKLKVQRQTRRKVLVTAKDYRNGTLYRVQIGPLIGVGESDELQARIAKDGLGRAFTVIR